jgi:hypothetical protein
MYYNKQNIKNNTSYSLEVKYKFKKKSFLILKIKKDFFDQNETIINSKTL